MALGDQLTLPQLCEDQSRPACCYTIVSYILNKAYDLFLTWYFLQSSGPQKDLYLPRYLHGCE
jgi:hypothetical protein